MADINRVGGFVGAMVDRTIRQLDADTPYGEALVAQDVVLDPAARRACDDYCGDLSGRYLEAVALTRTFDLPVDWGKATRIAHAVVDAQRPDGGFGPARPGAVTDHGVAWGNGRLLTGLLAFARANGDPYVEKAATRLAEHLIAAVPGWLEWFADPENARLKFALDFLSALDPLVAWHRHTGDGPALQAAGRLAAVIPEPSGEYHLHGYLLALRGWLELADVVGDRDAIETISQYWHAVRAGWILPHGGVLESLKTPRDINTEGCGIADWLMLTLRLHALSGDATMLDAAETSLYNALPHVQRASGHFGCETLCADPGLLTFDYPPEAWWCCTCHGLRALYDATRNAVRRNGSGIDVDMYIDSAGRVDGASYDIRTDYPRGGAVTIMLRAESPMRLGLRIPGTSTVARISPDAEYHAGYAVLPIDGDSVVNLELEPAFWVASGLTRFVTPTGNCTDATGPLHGRRGAVFRGPVLLAADAHRNDPEHVLRSRRCEIRVDGDRFSLPPADEPGTYRGDGLGYAMRFPLVLSPLADQTDYHRDVTSRIEFDEIVGVAEVNEETT